MAKGIMYVDNIRVEFDDEPTIMDVCRKAGVEMPNFCFHSDLSVYGACRMCMVEDLDTGKIDAACTTKPKNGMRIRTNTSRLLKYRRMILELMLASHCRDCTACEKNRSCRLQEMAVRFGIHHVHFKDTREHVPMDFSSPAVTFDLNKCILCGDCVRVCKEVQGMSILHFAGRGPGLHIEAGDDQPISTTHCVSCGQCAAVCTTGAITVNDQTVDMELLYIDDLVDEMLGALLGEEHRCGYEGLERVEGDGFCYVPETDVKTLGEIVYLLDGFRDSRETLAVPDLSDGSFSKKLWSTFLSYYEPGHFAYSLKPNTDDRGSFTEFLRTPERGQVSINVSRPGITKGNHWHMSKWERFLVVSGTASIKLRKVGEDADGNPFPVDEYTVSGSDMRAVEMIPGYTHSITNLSDTEDLVTVMWANEHFDPESPDTYYEEV